MMTDYLPCKFPRLRDDPSYRKIPADPNHPIDLYNCVAHALGKTDALWGPQHKWLPELNRRPEAPDHLNSYIEFFEYHDYRKCSDVFDVQPEHFAFEEGVEKVALYVKKKMAKSANGFRYLQCAHVAKQLPSGRWSSKNNQFHIFEHALESLESDDRNDAPIPPAIPDECKEPHPEGGLVVHQPINDWCLALIMTRRRVNG